MAIEIITFLNLGHIQLKPVILSMTKCNPYFTFTLLISHNPQIVFEIYEWEYGNPLQV